MSQTTQNKPNQVWRPLVQPTVWFFWMESEGITAGLGFGTGRKGFG